MDRFDIAIIGTGPAGLSAAITATIRNKKVLLLGSNDLSTKLQKAHRIDNYLGLPAISGSDLAAAFTSHLQSMNISITEDKINAIYPMGDYYALQGANGIYESRTLILATGVIMGKQLPGEAELLGRGVSYCATCDAALYRGKEVAVIGYSEKEEEEALFLCQMCAKVYYFPMYKGTFPAHDKLVVVEETPQQIVQENGKRRVVASNSYDVDGVFVLRDSIAPSQLIPGLKLDGIHAEVDRRMATKLDGCFACGDIAGLPYQYIKAAGEGNNAALSACAYLDTHKG